MASRDAYEVASQEWRSFGDMPEELVALGPHLVVPAGTALEAEEEFEDFMPTYLALARPEPRAGGEAAKRIEPDQLAQLAFGSARDVPDEIKPVGSYAELVAVILADVMYGYESPDEFIDPSYDTPRIAKLLGLDVELSDALLVALRFVDQKQRVAVVQRFYAGRTGRRVTVSWPQDELRTFDDRAVELQLAAWTALSVLDLTRNPALDSPVIRDLLEGASGRVPGLAGAERRQPPAASRVPSSSAACRFASAAEARSRVPSRMGA